MGLVDYSDSDASDVEQVPTTKLANSKPSFQKVVDRSNPGKIRVSLPQAVFKEDNHADEPPTKRAKTAGGSFSGFNSFLPPPKRTNQTNTATSADSAKKPGVGPGMSLKTSSTRGFSREPAPERDTEEEDTLPPLGLSGLNLPPPKSADSLDLKPADEVKLVGKPLMFKPLSVSRKTVKKKKQMAESTSTVARSLAIPTTPEAKVEKPAPRPKVSLFSMATDSEKIPVSTSNGEYKSIIYGSGEKGGDENEDAEDESFEFKPSYEEYTPNTRHMAPPAVPTPPVSQSLDDIAGDLNLTESQKRQLFGRQKGGRIQSATKVINFNTDQEYLHNEELRAAGEQVVHNAVRSIAPGKHSLKQLVNAAQSQKDALEESFAKGRSNRAEASSRYGW